MAKGLKVERRKEKLLEQLTVFLGEGVARQAKAGEGQEPSLSFKHNNINYKSTALRDSYLGDIYLNCDFQI